MNQVTSPSSGPVSGLSRRLWDHEDVTEEHSHSRPLTIPTALMPAGRTVRVRSQQGPTGTGRLPRLAQPHGPRAPLTARPRSGTWSARSATGLASCSRCPRATRSSSATAARRRSGTSRPSAWSATAPSTSAFGEFSAKFGSVTQNAPFLGDSTIIKAEPGTRPAHGRGRRRRLRVGRTTRPRTGVMAPVRAGRGRRRGRPGARRRHLRRRRPAGRRRRGRRLLLRPAEVLRGRRRPLAGRLLPRGPGARRRDRGLRPLGARLLQPADGDQQQPPEPDLQHPRGRARWRCSPTRSGGSTSRAASTGP